MPTTHGGSPPTGSLAGMYPLLFRHVLSRLDPEFAHHAAIPVIRQQERDSLYLEHTGPIPRQTGSIPRQTGSVATPPPSGGAPS